MLVEPIHLVNAAIVAVSIQESLILWHKSGFRGICFFMLLVACAAVFNIVEASADSQSTFIISPIFQLLFGPALFLACKGLMAKKNTNNDWLHFIPVLVALFFAKYVQLIIAFGTISRIGYSLLTAKTLVQYKQKLDAERSDSDEYSLQWLVWLVLVTAAFNLLDLIRLNVQSYISVETNMLGQVLNNSLWLFVIMFISYKLHSQKASPNVQSEHSTKTSDIAEDTHLYQAIFSAIDDKMKDEQLFRTERLTLTELAKILELQSRDISRAINLISQKSFNDYINTMRVDYVCQGLTANNNNSITELAFEAGFSSKAVFNRSFKQITGVTPSQYRKNHTN